MIDIIKEEREKKIAYEKHKDMRIQEMHERFVNYKLKKKKEKQSI